MNRRQFCKGSLLGAAAMALPQGLLAGAAEGKRPNILYVVLDEWGYYEMSGMGNRLLETPVIDRLAREGLRFTQLLAGGPVRAPTRCALLTGKHAGHMTVRANGGSDPIRDDEATIASMLKAAGYATGGFGKWGIGGRGTTGVPEKHGFDVFFGYYDQVHAHSYFPRYLIRNSQDPVFRLSSALAVVLVLGSSLGVAVSGHFQGQQVADLQPMKHAATEALWETEAPAALSLFAIPDRDEGRNLIDIRIPRLLSLLTDHSFSSEVRGINDLQAEYVAQFGEGDYRPPVGAVYWSFRVMVGAGFALIGLGALGAWFLHRKRLHEVSWYHRAALLALGLPFLANITGWVVTEMGRQPWSVYNVLLVRDSVSPSVGTASVLISLIGFTVLYGALAVIDLYLMVKYARAGAGEETTPAEVGAGLAY
jgi:hypothetical protein